LEICSWFCRYNSARANIFTHRDVVIAMNSIRSRHHAVMSFLADCTVQFIFVTDCLPTRLSTVGDRAFPVAAARVWNSPPDLVTSAPSVAVFRSRLKTHPFNISYPSPL